jgi:hypothetical protein
MYGLQHRKSGVSLKDEKLCVKSNAEKPLHLHLCRHDERLDTYQMKLPGMGVQDKGKALQNIIFSLAIIQSITNWAAYINFQRPSNKNLIVYYKRH